MATCITRNGGPTTTGNGRGCGSGDDKDAASSCLFNSSHSPPSRPPQLTLYLRDRLRAQFRMVELLEQLQQPMHDIVAQEWKASGRGELSSSSSSSSSTSPASSIAAQLPGDVFNGAAPAPKMLGASSGRNVAVKKRMLHFTSGRAVGRLEEQQQ